ncbi:YcaO-like family protein [Marinilactibacillus sp. 15R]|uniref:YcaO-like family protein n=1 Tax=Marinilactibacillus sp. 15R TaxID=1911586 RepID=UPI001E39B52A|nr:YcaO-like family protein [Marinilactibacillus sp. 15R]
MSLTSESLTYIDPARIYLNFDLPGLKNYEKSFQDSCGLASYTDSENTLINSVKEFIERQSFIATWLTKKTNVQYNINEVNNLFHGKNEMLENHFSTFECFDISIFPGIYVLFLIGYSDQIYSVGIGTSTSFKEAYRSALNEFYQCFDAAIASYNNLNKKAVDIYKDYYMNIGVDNFKKAYVFLKKSPVQNIPFNEVQKDNIDNLINIINFFGIEAYLISIPSQVTNANIRITKVFSYDAFPHMNTAILKPENYKISKMLNIKEFPNKGIPIPFP